MLFWVHRAGQHPGKLWNASRISSRLAEAARGKSRAQPCPQTWAPCPVSVGSPKDSCWRPLPIAAAARGTKPTAPSAAYCGERTCCGIPSPQRKVLNPPPQQKIPMSTKGPKSSNPGASFWYLSVTITISHYENMEKKEEKTFSITGLTRFARMKKKMTILQAALYLLLPYVHCTLQPLWELCRCQHILCVKCLGDKRQRWYFS